MIIGEDTLINFFRNVVGFWPTMKVKLFGSFVGANCELTTSHRATHLFLDEVGRAVFLKELLDVLPIKAVVLSATLPPNDVVSLVMGVVKLDHELELKALLWSQLLHLGVRNFSHPEMPISPLHLHAALTAVLIGIPAAQKFR